MLESLKAYVEQHEAQFLRCLMNYVDHPSLATVPGDVERCVQFLQATMQDAGITTRVLPSAGNPIVFGEVRAEREDAPTVLFYGHYDVQPPEPLDAWTTPPFTATLRDGRVYGRGVGDNKGQHLAHILAVKTYLEMGGKPSAHLKFIIEGEEEVGSGSLPGFALQHRDLLKADIVYVSDGPMHETGAPIVCFGNRGVFNFGIEVNTATTDNHSGNRGGVIPNAAWELVRLLSTMVDEDGNATVEGFYDDVLSPSEYELGLIDKLPYDPAESARVFGVPALLAQDRRDYYRRLCFSPTLTINALGCGHPGETKNIIPAHAVAKLDIRLVAHQDPARVFERIRAHVEKQKVQGTVRVFHEGDDMFPSKTDAQLPLCRKITEIVKKARGREITVLPALGGSVPSSVWTVTLGMPAILVPYANADERNHAPNENLRVDCFLQGILTTAMVLHELGSAP